MPVICAGSPPLQTLERFGIFGCEVAHARSGITAHGDAVPCSFLPRSPVEVENFSRVRDDEPTLRRYRSHFESAPEPCASYPYRTA